MSMQERKQLYHETKQGGSGTAADDSAMDNSMLTPQTRAGGVRRRPAAAPARRAAAAMDEEDLNDLSAGSAFDEDDDVIDNADGFLVGGDEEDEDLAGVMDDSNLDFSAKPQHRGGAMDQSAGFFEDEPVAPRARAVPAMPIRRRMGGQSKAINLKNAPFIPDTERRAGSDWQKLFFGGQEIVEPRNKNDATRLGGAYEQGITRKQFFAIFDNAAVVNERDPIRKVHESSRNGVKGAYLFTATGTPARTAGTSSIAPAAAEEGETRTGGAKRGRPKKTPLTKKQVAAALNAFKSKLGIKGKKKSAAAKKVVAAVKKIFSGAETRKLVAQLRGAAKPKKAKKKSAAAKKKKSVAAAVKKIFSAAETKAIVASLRAKGKKPAKKAKAGKKKLSPAQKVSKTLVKAAGIKPKKKAAATKAAVTRKLRENTNLKGGEVAEPIDETKAGGRASKNRKKNGQFKKHHGPIRHRGGEVPEPIEEETKVGGKLTKHQKRQRAARKAVRTKRRMGLLPPKRRRGGDVEEVAVDETKVGGLTKRQKAKRRAAARRRAARRYGGEVAEEQEVKVAGRASANRKKNGQFKSGHGTIRRHAKRRGGDAEDDDEDLAGGSLVEEVVVEEAVAARAGGAKRRYKRKVAPNAVRRTNGQFRMHHAPARRGVHLGGASGDVFDGDMTTEDVAGNSDMATRTAGGRKKKRAPKKRASKKRAAAKRLIKAIRRM